MNLTIKIQDKIYVIAEIGINHNGSIDIAKQLIQIAKNCGCDAVKFQKRDVETVYSKEELDKPRKSPWGTTQRQQKMGLEFGKKEYDEINAFCKSINIEWFASAWDLKSLEFLKQYDLKINKIASAMITNIKFLEECAKMRLKTFISTGMSNYTIIDEAVGIFKKYQCPFELMHSVSVYPCPDEILNLNNIVKLQSRYNCNVGYSGHEPSVSPSIIAAVLGATSIERHITLDRAMYGSDQSASMEEPGLKNFINSIRKIKTVIGNSEKNFQPGELEVAKKLRYWEK
jgi:N-acetylneuraminate synthase